MIFKVISSSNHSGKNGEARSYLFTEMVFAQKTEYTAMVSSHRRDLGDTQKGVGDVLGINV